MILVVTGSRSIGEAQASGELGRLLGDELPTLLVHGDAEGVDRGCARWAVSKGIDVKPVPAVWRVNGQRDMNAGKRRNWTMLRRAVATAKARGEAVQLIAIWDGLSGGTAHCVAAAVALGVPVRMAHLSSESA